MLRGPGDTGPVEHETNSRPRECGFVLQPGDANDPASRAAFEELFRQVYPRLLRFFRSNRYSEEDAEDLTQQTLLRVFRFGGQFNDASGVWVWLFCIARNVLKNHRRDARTLKRSARLESLESLGERGSIRLERAIGEASLAGQDACEAAIERQALQRLRVALETLPPKMRRCLHLRLCHDLENPEIARLLKTSEETVKSHIFQAKLKLRRRLGPGFGLGGG